MAEAEIPEEDEEDIILSELNDDELVEQMHDDLYNGLKKRSSKALISCSSVAGVLTRFSMMRW